MLSVSLLVVSSIWSIFIVENLYHSTDSLPLFDIIPPFVDTNFGEYYQINKFIVWGIWILLIGGAVLTSYFLTKKVQAEIK